jgi:hypothetical protein
MHVQCWLGVLDSPGGADVDSLAMALYGKRSRA